MTTPKPPQPTEAQRRRAAECFSGCRVGDNMIERIAQALADERASALEEAAKECDDEVASAVDTAVPGRDNTVLATRRTTGRRLAASIRALLEKGRPT